MTRFPLPAVTGLSFLLVLAPGCGRSATGRSATEAGRPPVAVDVTRAAATEVERSVDVVGTLAASREADVKSEYSGTVVEVFVTQWVRVKAGAPLARLDTREADAGLAAARAAALQADVAARRAARELERTVQLKDAGLATRQGVDEARSVEEAARATASAAKAQLEMAEARRAKAILRAPIDGVVAARSVNVGDYVENMGNPPAIFRIVDNRVLELTANVPSARMAELGPGQPFTFTSDAFPGKELAGRVSFINPTADEASRTVKVKAEVPNPDESLKAGLFVKGRIVTGKRSGVLVVPRAALVSWDTVARTAAVFVVDGGVAKRVTVETGAPAGEGVEVVKGLLAGQEVVTRGGFSLRDGDRVRTGTGA